jgi:hypothetical protein
VRLGRVSSALAFIFLLGVSGLSARAQSPDSMFPEQSAAKAKQLMQQAIQALGGPAYLGVKDVTRIGRSAQFGHSGGLTGYIKFYDYAKPPDKDRREFGDKHNIIFVSTATDAWVMDKGGVQDSPADAVSNNQEAQKKDIAVLFRTRLNDPDLEFRWAGAAVIDLRRVDWVEINDTEHRTMRIAFDQQTHLPSRAEYHALDRTTRERTDEVVYYANYHSIQGIETPFQVARDRNGYRVSQVFFDECKYNTGLDDSLFTRASLEERFAQLNKGKKHK